MSLRQVLTIYNAERQLNEDDAALLNTLRRFTDSERALFVEQLSDKPQKKPGKRTSTKSASKSPRASGMAAAISNSLESSRKATAVGDEDNCVNCSSRADDNIHHMATMKGYHPFVPPAQSADGPSSANNGATGSTASSEMGKGAASNVHHAGG